MRPPPVGHLMICCIVINLITLTPRDADAWGPFSYTETRYPIVLAHGMLGFEKLFGVLDYWYGIPQALARGGAQVYVTDVSPMASNEARGEQLLDGIETIVAVSGKPKVNLMCHSHGGLDCRYVAAVRPDLVASVSTVGSPHHGADLADFVRNHVSEGSLSETALALLVDSFATLLGLLAGHTRPNDSIEALESVTSEGAATFNAQYPKGLPTEHCGSGPLEVDGIRYYSWSGTSIITNAFDPLDYAFGASSLVYREENDGLTGRCSSHFGKVLRDDYNHNHADEVNQILGLRSMFASNPKSIFRAHANRLKNAGL